MNATGKPTSITHRGKHVENPTPPTYGCCAAIRASTVVSGLLVDQRLRISGPCCGSPPVVSGVPELLVEAFTLGAAPAPELRLAGGQFLGLIGLAADVRSREVLGEAPPGLAHLAPVAGGASAAAPLAADSLAKDPVVASTVRHDLDGQAATSPVES